MFKKLLLLSLLALPVVTQVDASCPGGCCGGSCGIRRAPVRSPRIFSKQCSTCGKGFRTTNNKIALCGACRRK